MTRIALRHSSDSSENSDERGKSRKPRASAWSDEMLRIGQRAVQEAIEENRRLGVPNVYCYDGVLYWELPDGTLSPEDPWKGKSQAENP